MLQNIFFINFATTFVANKNFVKFATNFVANRYI